jgi:hypothetical protein
MPIEEMDGIGGDRRPIRSSNVQSNPVSPWCGIGIAVPNEEKTYWARYSDLLPLACILHAEAQETDGAAAETLRVAYALAKKNDGAPGTDGVTFEAIEAQGVEAFLERIRDELNGRSYVPLPARKQEIPKDGGKIRVLSIPTHRA